MQAILNIVTNKDPEECGEEVLGAINERLVEFFDEHIDTIDVHVIIQHFDQELIKCCRIFYQVLLFSPSSRLSSSGFFMASVYHNLIQQHPNATQHRQVTDPEIIARLSSTIRITDESMLRYFRMSYDSVHWQFNT